jgi:hypothetical protein
VVVAASLIVLLGRDPAGSPERLASPPAEAVETGLLLQWLAEIREIDERLFLVSDRDFDRVCQEGLDSLAQGFQPVPDGAARLIPPDLTPALAAQAGPLRSAWTDLVDATMRRLQRCAAGELTAAENAQLQRRIEDARAELDRLLRAPPVADSEG